MPRADEWLDGKPARSEPMVGWSGKEYTYDEFAALMAGRSSSRKEELPMSAYEKVEVELQDEECEVESAFVEAWPDGARRYTCKVHIVAYLPDGTKLKGVGMFGLYENE